MEINIQKAAIKGEITAPASKSYAQRALAIATLTKGKSIIHNIEHNSDVNAVLGLIPHLGAKINHNKEAKTVEIEGKNFNELNNRLFIGESGLATRLFTPIASLFDFPITIDGHKTILSRPMDSMKMTLESAGVDFKSNNGYLPLTVQGPIKGGCLEVDGSLSSQFLSGLLIALPLCENDTTLEVKNLKSKPYVDMTIEVIRAAGGEIINDNYTYIYIKGGQNYTPFEYNVEGDWSGASCLLVAGATAGKITINNLMVNSSQADAKIIEALEKAGAKITYGENSISVEKAELKAFEFDATHCPDLFPALAALAASCEGESNIIGTSRLTHKESDRAETIKTTFSQLGVKIDISTENVMKITGSRIKGGERIDSYGDHRIAMSVAVAALNSDKSVTITSAEAVEKSYTNFWKDFSTVCY